MNSLHLKTPQQHNLPLHDPYDHSCLTKPIKLLIMHGSFVSMCLCIESIMIIPGGGIIMKNRCVHRIIHLNVNWDLTKATIREYVSLQITIGSTIDLALFGSYIV